MNVQAGSGAYPKNLNREIHGLRGFSTLAVFIYHVYGMGTLWNFWPPALNPVAPIFEAGKHGVEIFFVISGYLITGSLVRHGDASKFLIDRAIRLYPVFLTIQIIVFGLGPIVHYKWLSGISPSAWGLAFIENGLFLPGIFNLPLAQLNAWSLSFEAAFYLLSAACFVLFKRFGRWPIFAVLALVLAFVILRDTRAIFFMPGVLVFFLSRKSLLHVPGWTRVLSLPALILTLALLTLAATTPALIYVAALAAFLFFMCVVEGKCMLSAILRTRPLQYLGTISYSFYLWSPAVTYPMKIVIERYLHDRLDDRVNIALFAAFGFVASVAVAHLSYRVLEDRAGRALHRWAGSRPLAVRPT